MEMEVYGTSRNGIKVYKHPEGHPHPKLLGLLEEAISMIDLPEDNTFCEGVADIGVVIGRDHLVETDDDDEIVFLQRGDRPGFSRMVLNKEAPLTSFVTVIMCVAHDPDEFAGKWCVLTAYEGKPGHKEPFDSRATAQDIEFWKNHALVPTKEELWDIQAALSE
jgi:hypothetical protein